MVTTACVGSTILELPPTFALERKFESHSACSPSPSGGMSGGGFAGSKVRSLKFTGAFVTVGLAGSLNCPGDVHPEMQQTPHQERIRRGTDRRSRRRKMDRSSMEICDPFSECIISTCHLFVAPRCRERYFHGRNIALLQTNDNCSLFASGSPLIAFSCSREREWHGR